MLDNRKNNLKKINSMFAAAAAFALLVTGCGLNSQTGTETQVQNNSAEKTAELTASLSEESTSASAVNLLSDTVPYSANISDLFTERDLRTDYEITETVNLNEITDSVLTLTQEGVYELTGTFNGQIRINTEGKIQLILNQANITCSDGSAIYVENAKKTFITLAENSENALSDGTGYSNETTDGAVIWSADSLTINGTGTLKINGNEADGIVSKDDLVITGGNIIANTVGNGIKGKDYIAVYDGSVTVTAGGDGLKTTNLTDEGMGFIYIRNGNFSIQAEQDGIQAESELIIENGSFAVTSGGGTANAVTKHNDFGGGGSFGKGGFPAQDSVSSDSDSDEDSDSIKGLKAGTLLCISNGTFDFDTADDAVHSNGSLYITGGTLNISAGDKGIHADSTVTVSGGLVNISKSYEGIESANILISGGTVKLTSSDDGFNASDGTEQGAMGVVSDCSLEISGGYVYVNADGDGLDSNGTLTISGGTVIVDGPTNDGNGALDSNNGIKLTGGLLIAAGSSGMAEYPDDASQNVIVMTLDTYQNADTLVTLCDDSGTEILSFAPSKKFSSVIYSSDVLASGKTYTLTLGGSSSGSQTDGLYETGGYQKDGTESGSVTIADTVSFIGTAKGMGGQRGGFGGGGRMPDNMELPTDENGEITMPENFDPSQRKNFGGKMPDNMELPTDENGEIIMPENFGRNREQQNS